MDGVKRGNLKPNFTLNTKTTLFHLNEAMCFGYVLTKTTSFWSTPSKKKVR
jgi:hypothetical protein